MTIADKLTRLSAAHDDIIDAINAKGGSATGDGFEDFAADIESLPPTNVNVYTSSAAAASGAVAFSGMPDEFGEYSECYWAIVRTAGGDIADGKLDAAEGKALDEVNTAVPKTASAAIAYSAGTLTLTGDLEDGNQYVIVAWCRQ